MTVSTQVSRNEYTGNGATTQYDFTFRILDKSHLLVQTLDTSENIVTLTLGTDYTVTGVNRYNGGKVVLTSALPAGYKISIERSTPVTQEASIRNQGGFFPEIHEDAFDKLTMLVQQAYGWWSGLSLRKPSWLANYYDALNNRIRNLRDPSQAQDAATKGYADNLYQGAISHSDNNFKRTLRVPESEVGMLPGISGRRKKILAFNDTGNPIAVLPESGSAADVMIELAAGDGASHIGGLNYVTPEMPGFVTGAGNADADTAAIQWALNQNAKQVVLDSTKTYNIKPGAIQHTGKINVDAGTAKIVCDGIAIDIIDGAGSVWKGGNLLSKTTPWTVVYDEDFNIVESGNLGYGRMPYQDDTNVDSSHYYQQICCSLVFRSSTSDVLDGLTVSGVKGSYAAVVAAGFKNTKWTHNKIRGGALAGAIMVLNDCELPVTAGFGWNAGTDVSYANPFKWARGSNHSFVNCDLFEGRQMGLCVTGSDCVTISDVNTYDNAESGVQTGQYSSAYPQESIICKHVIQTGCKSWGNYYDGFDHASVTSGAAGPYFDKYLTVTACESFNNRATGIFTQGNNLQIKGNNFHDNGTHGIRVQDSAVVDISRNQCLYNGKLAGGYQIAAVGSDMSVDDNTVLNTSQTDSHLVNISIGLQTQKQFGVKFKNTPLSTRSSPKTVIGIGVLMTGDEKTSDGSEASYSGVRTSGYIPAPIAGDTRTKSVASEAGAVAAWKHPSTGAWMRLFTNDLTGATNTGFSFGYNWGKNTSNPSGYWDNAGIGGTLLTFYPTAIVFDIHAAGSMSSVGGVTIASTVLRPNIDNTISGGQSTFRFTQLFATNSTIGTCDADEKMEPVNPNEAEINAFYEISLLPWVWQWLEKYQVEGDNARLHSGPTVQAAIAIMDKHGLDWTRYAAFCYNEWDAWDGGIDPVTMVYVPPYEAGHRYGFRKEELLLWMLRATVEKQKSIDARLSALESN
ncbi:phage tail fiber domain-containing protein [Klebsiella pneumoniae]